VAVILRKKSPRAPSLALDEALDRALRAYEQERLHPAPVDVVAQNIGYKDANNGRALSALASLRYFGLMERPKEGLMCVTKEVEAYKFAPDNVLKHALLVNFLKRPALYGELLDKYESGLPSDANLKFELIQKGFAPQGAEATLAAFRRSVEFADYFGSVSSPADELRGPNNAPPVAEESDSEPTAQQQVAASGAFRSIPSTSVSELGGEDELDRIPVRLTGGRRAWLVIPTPFYTADKSRLKAQIDLLLTEEEEGDEETEAKR
jgi:hypothetical protein